MEKDLDKLHQTTRALFFEGIELQLYLAAERVYGVEKRDLRSMRHGDHRKHTNLRNIRHNGPQVKREISL